MKCGNCNTENDAGCIFCYQCGVKISLSRDTVTDFNVNGNPQGFFVIVIIALVLVFPLFFSLVPASDSTGQFTLKEWEMSADTDHLGIGFGYWVHAGEKMDAYVYNLNNTDAYLLRITEYTQKTQVLATRDYNVSGVVNLTIQYTFSDFIYLVNNNGNITFTLYRGDRIVYREFNGQEWFTYQVINRSSLVYMNACYILPV